MKSVNNNAISNFYQIMCSSSFSPYILQPTRITLTSATLIDNIFFNSPEFSTLSGNFIEQISDHLTQCLVIKNYWKNCPNISKKMTIRDYSNFNHDEFRNDLIQLTGWIYLLIVMMLMIIFPIS